MSTTNEKKFYTIESTSEDGIYYLVKNATDTKKWWTSAVREGKHMPISEYTGYPIRFFATPASAENCLYRRKNAYSDFADYFKTDKFRPVEITVGKNGVITSVKRINCVKPH